MNQQRAIDMMSGRRGGAGGALFRGVTWVLSKPYGAALRLRRWVYRVGVFGGRKASVPVISIGNITTGGTGKTPMVIWVVQRLKEAGMNPAILTRGYKAVEGRSDEAQLLWEATHSPVVVDPDRVAAAGAAAEAGADVLVLDDGFQHLRLKRDLDIVLIDATNPFGFGHCLPRGLLREGPRALRDAGAIIITRCDLVAPAGLDALSTRLGKLAPQASLHRSGQTATAVVVEAGRHLPPAHLKGRKVCAFCGIGNPRAFFASLDAAGAEVVERLIFDDHVAYGDAELARIGEAARACEAEALITTPKDRVKLVPTALPLPLWTLRTEVRVREGQAALMDAIRAAIGR